MSRSLQAKNANEEQVGAPWQGRHKVFKNTLLKLGLQDLLKGGGWMPLQHSCWHLLQATGSYGNVPVALQLCAPAGMGFTFITGSWDEIITDSNTGLAWTRKTGFIPLPSVIIFHYWYLNFWIPVALAQIVPSTERDVDKKRTIEELKHYCVTDAA